MEVENSNQSSIASTSNLLTGPLDFTESTFDSLTNGCSAANFTSNNNHSDEQEANNVTELSLAASQPPKKCSAAHRKLQMLMAAGKISSLPARKPIVDERTEINLVGEDKENAKVNETDAWFLKKLGKSATVVRKEKDADSKEKITSEKYKKVRQQIEEQLSVRRREEMERRHCFYNADNENFDNEEEEEEEEEEISDEEEEDLDEAKEDDGNSRKKRKNADENNADTNEKPKKRPKFDVNNEEEEDEDDDFSADINVIIDEDCSNSAAFLQEHNRLQKVDASATVNNNISSSVVVVPSGFLHGSNSNEFSHISLDLNGADDAMSGVNPSASQDFNEALFLCSGTFGESNGKTADFTDTQRSNNASPPKSKINWDSSSQKSSDFSSSSSSKPVHPFSKDEQSRSSGSSNARPPASLPQAPPKFLFSESEDSNLSLSSYGATKMGAHGFPAADAVQSDQTNVIERNFESLSQILREAKDGAKSRSLEEENSPAAKDSKNVAGMEKKTKKEVRLRFSSESSSSDEEEKNENEEAKNFSEEGNVQEKWKPKCRDDDKRKGRSIKEDKVIGEENSQHSTDLRKTIQQINRVYSPSPSPLSDRFLEDGEQFLQEDQAGGDSRLEGVNNEHIRRKRICSDSSQDGDDNKEIDMEKLRADLFLEDDEDVESEAKPSEEVSSNIPTDQSHNKLFTDDQLFTVDDDDDGNGEFGTDWPDENEWNINSKVYGNEVNDADKDDDDDNSDSEVKRKRIKISDVLDDEASLSGDDVGSEDSDNSDNDEYDEEEGDKDQLPDDEVIRENLVKQYIKQTNDDEERRMLQLQEKFFVDADLHGTKDIDRSFRFRMRDDSNVDWSKVLGKLEKEGRDGSDGEEADEGEAGGSEAAEIREKKVEMLKWKLEQEKKKAIFNTSVECVEIFAQSSLLALGERSIFSNATTSSISTREYEEDGDLSSLMKRDSLLKKASSLGQVLKESSSVEVRTHSLFTSTTSTQPADRKRNI